MEHLRLAGVTRVYPPSESHAAVHALGPIDLREVGVDRVQAGNAFEEIGAVAIVEQLRRGHADVDRAERGEIGRHADEPFGLRKGKRPQDDRVDHREDRAGRADTEREREQRHDGESRLLAEAADRKPDILKDVLHDSITSLSRPL